MNFNTGEGVTRHGKITEISITGVIIKAAESMASCQTMICINIHNRYKVIYRPNDWISGGEYEEYDDDPNNPDMP